jgi:hypothetical protein
MGFEYSLGAAGGPAHGIDSYPEPIGFWGLVQKPEIFT